MSRSRDVLLLGALGVLVYLYRDKIFAALGTGVTTAITGASGRVTDVISQATGLEDCASYLVNENNPDPARVRSLCSDSVYQSFLQGRGAFRPAIDVTPGQG